MNNSIDNIIKNLSDGNIYSNKEIADLSGMNIEYVNGVLNDPIIAKTCGDGYGVIYYMDIKYDTIVDGVNFRNTVYCAKCSIHCEGCHNPQSWSIRNGRPISVNKLSELLLENGNDITFSGGECSLQAKAFIRLAQILKNEGRNIWLYSGYTYEKLFENPITRKLLNSVDILVDGRFIKELKDLSLSFRGSSNQRIIDVKETMKQNKIILWNR